MAKPKMGLVGLCSHFESGGQRHDELISSAANAMEVAGIDVVVANRSVWDPVDAMDVCDQFKEAGIESVAIMFVTWATDDMPYLFINELKVPVLFWAVPYPETFSIGCVQEAGGVLKAEGIHFEYVYGLADDAALIAKVKMAAEAAQIVKKVKSMRICLMGPRQTWRAAGPQDMTTEEWEFSEKFGSTIIHTRIDDVEDAARNIPDADAKEVFEKELKAITGKQVNVSEECLLWMTKMYMATKSLVDAMHLDAVAAECYPAYSGLMNQTASWLCEQGIICDTEGDIAHVVVQQMLNMAANGGACALGEIGAFDDKAGYVTICHEGSTAPSLAESLDKVAVNASGDMGAFIGVPMKAMDKVTYCDMQGFAGNYQLFAAKGSTLPVSHDEWVEAGSKLVVKLKDEKAAPSEIVDSMIRSGLHHHIIIKEGDYVALLQMVVKYMNVKVTEV